MARLEQQAENRRGFFRSAGRYVLLSLLAVGGAVAARPGRLAGQRCLKQGICSRCGAFNTCGLPAALSAKTVRNKVTS
ncbi:MAG TPA: hypothetical protein VN673_13325 [Clostridia bacterium]|nr:hypothetical protein [Clostridia bacterium]